MAWAWRVLRIVVPLFAACWLFVMIFEESFIYFPTRYPDGDWQAPEREEGMAVEDVWLRTEDGVRIHGWYVRARGREPVGAVLFFHGNGGNLTHRFPQSKLMAELGWAVLLLDYRGYGRSEGSPGEEGLYRDSDAAYGHLRERGFAPERIVLFGESLGGAVAIDLASRVECGGLVVESSFTSVPAMARRVFPIPPLWLLVRTRFDSLSKIASVRVPKLILHSPADEVVPFDMGRALFEAAAEPKEFWEIPAAPHTAAFFVHPAEYAKRIGGFLDRLLR